MTDTNFRLVTPLESELADHDADEEVIISALEHAPTGAPMRRRDHALLVLLGVVLPVLLLIWGWA